MQDRRTLRTLLCDRLGIATPILLAGMALKGRATPPELVAAVSEAGGLGVMGCSWTAPEEVRARIRRVRSLTSRPFGVDLILPASMEPNAVADWAQMRQRIHHEHPEHLALVRRMMEEFELRPVPPPPGEVLAPESIRACVEVVLQERVPVFVAGLGDPAWMVADAHRVGIQVMGLAGSLRHAQRQQAAGVDFVIAQGSEAGGHTGVVPSLVLWPQVVDLVSPLPVVAAGGIGDGRAVAAALALGCVGVWVGTAFLLAQECGIHSAHKEQIASGRSEDFVVTRAYTGKTGRDYRNEVIRRWEDSGLPALPMPLQSLLMEDLLAAAEAQGRFELLNNPAGQVGGMLNRVRPAREIFEQMQAGAEARLRELTAMLN
ncbi:MAG TPA: nitronate monooxygenase [Candidatus Nitrosotalea sp.]|nr:nitronate monooxygenase [Candidatus Nitrosotalea sp.]